MKWRKTKKDAKARLKAMRAASDVEAFAKAADQARVACDAAAEGMRRMARAFTAGTAQAAASLKALAAAGYSVNDFRRGEQCPVCHGELGEHWRGRPCLSGPGDIPPRPDPERNPVAFLGEGTARG